MNYSKANKLALESNLSRKVLSVRFDDKRSQWCVTHEVSKGLKDIEGYRCDVDYFMFDNVAGFKIDKALLFIKASATLAFLGVDEEEAVKEPKIVKPKKEPEGKVVYEASDDEDEDEDEEEAKPDIGSKPKVKRKRKTKAKVEVEPEPEPEPAVVEEVDPLELPEEDAENQIYMKNKSDHAVHLRDLVEEKYGSEWKKNKNAVAVVKGIVGKLHNNVAVTDGNGAVLKSFVEFVDQHLKAA